MKKALIIVSVLVVVGVIGYIIYRQLTKSKGTDNPTETAPATTSVNKVENSVPNEVKPQVLPQITSTEVKPQVLPQFETIAVPAGKSLSASKIKLAKGFDLNVLSSELENIPSII